MNFFEFADRNPWVATALCVLIGMLVSLVIRSIHLLGIRFLRHRDILWQGWPPPHCDADGDQVTLEKAEEEEEED